MWLYRFIDSKTSGMIPELDEFIKRNHDLTGLFYEQTYLPAEERIALIQRFFKFIFYICTLMVFVFLVPKYYTDIYYTNMCLRRERCHQNCADDYYPSTDCNIKDKRFEHDNNVYKEMYIYRRPTGASNQERFEECLNYAKDNKNIKKSLRHNRQSRVHACFPYCADTDTFDESCTDALLCVPSHDDCEYVVPFNELMIKRNEPIEDSIAIAPLVGIYAMLITMPIQLVFEIYCVIVSKLKVNEADTRCMTILKIAMQFVTVIVVAVMGCFTAYCIITIQMVFLSLSYRLVK